MEQTATTLADQLFISRLDVISEDAVRSLLRLHPIQLTGTQDEYYVIAGIRTYQLALVRLGLTEKLPALMYPSLSDQEAQELAQIDLLGSALLHSLGTKSVTQLDRLKKHLGDDVSDRIAPGLRSTRAIQRFEKL